MNFYKSTFLLLRKWRIYIFNAFYGFYTRKIKNFYYWVLFLSRKPGGIKFLSQWRLFSNPNAFALFNVPWFVFEATEWLDAFLKKDMIVFEWGSGASTLYLATRVKKVVSVEHNNEWYKAISKRLASAGPSNCEYILKSPRPVSGAMRDSSANKKMQGGYLSFSPEYRNFSFEEYCQVIDSFPDKYFDLIIIDGRARNSCIFHAINKVKKSGVLLLDNSERKEYLPGISLLANWKRKDFWGPGQFQGFWQTSIFNAIYEYKKHLSHF